MQLSVIIVNYNVRYFLEQCLFSVQKAMRGINGEIWVVDNASKDGSRAYLEPLFPQVKFIWNAENFGFSKANNQALQYATGSFILFLNPDTILPEDCFSKCLDFFKNNLDAGALGVRMLDGNGNFLPESKRSFPSPSISFFKLSGLSSLLPKSKLFGKYHLGFLDENENHEVNVLAGAFMLVRKNVLDETGGFDEQFFMYGEDIDLSYRIQKTFNPATGNTFKNYYFSETSILHFKGESTKKGSLNYVRMFYLAMSQFVQKHFSSSSSTIFHSIIWLAIWARAVLSAVKQLIKQIGLPLIDCFIIWVSFWLTKELWIQYIKKETYYEPLLLYASFSGFSVLFLIVSYYTVLYQQKFRFSELWKSGVIMALILLVVYSLLPEYIRFSRGIVVIGCFFSLICLSLWRKFLLFLEMIEPASVEEEVYTLIIGTNEDAKKINTLNQLSKKISPVRGVISPVKEPDTLGSINELMQIVEGTPVRELIFCESNLISFKKIIDYYQQITQKVKFRICASGSSSIIGSDSKFYSGETIGGISFRLSLPLYRRLKRLTDVSVALILLLSFPLYVLYSPNFTHFLQNIFLVLIGKKTWIGYWNNASEDLPRLPLAVLGPSGIPTDTNKLNLEVQKKTNEWYAQEYTLLYDIYTIFSHYKDLGVS
jgi:GT2 family glycosyltransferase